AWTALEHEVLGDDGLAGLEAAVEACVGRDVSTHLLELTLTGRLGLSGTQRLEELLQRLEARLVRLKLDRRVGLEPQPDELEGLGQRLGDPAIASVARGLVAQLALPGAPGEVAREALQQLYQLVHAGTQPAGRA
ncbi:MAG: DNA repair exonuclease, partial [Planctomycetia bacterium]